MYINRKEIHLIRFFQTKLESSGQSFPEKNSHVIIPACQIGESILPEEIADHQKFPRHLHDPRFLRDPRFLMKKNLHDPHLMMKNLYVPCLNTRFSGILVVDSVLMLVSSIDLKLWDAPHSKYDPSTNSSRAFLNLWWSPLRKRGTWNNLSRWYLARHKPHSIISYARALYRRRSLGRTAWNFHFRLVNFSLRSISSGLSILSELKKWMILKNKLKYIINGTGKLRISQWGSGKIYIF